MNCIDYELLLDDYVDGELDGARRAEVERHVATCAACRAALGELGQLASAVGELPRGLAPERDLLPGIRRTALGRGGARWRLWAGLAASVALAATAVWIGLHYAGRPGTPPDREPGRLSADRERAWSVAQVTRAEFELAEQEYEEATARLLRLLDARADSLSPETRELVAENLRIIDQAIAELRTALDNDPNDARNGHALNSLYRHKVEFLWLMSRLSS
ncbi:MAG TPA: zf-HC2 domain-containing protein [Candidatus Polarisedimenticolaceae bacterium]|nr:zf-HC2 domain-containing protein [Candidatus Polarisedimenticolaceae bacterium]